VLLYDNLKSAVLQRAGTAIQFHPALLELAGHCHFRPDACNPAAGWEKGIVEAGIRYIRSSFAGARTYKDLADANAQLRRWLDEVCNVRPWPGDRTRTVRDAFAEEVPRLLSLPAHDPPTAAVRVVRSGKTAHIRYDLNDYSIPHELVRKPLTLVAEVDVIRILDGTEVVARHARSWDRGQRIEDPAHFQGLLDRRPRGFVPKGRDRLRAVAPTIDALFELLVHRSENLGSNVGRLVVLLDQYGADEFSRGTPGASSVGNILDRRRRAKRRRPILPVSLPDDPRVRDLRVVSHDLATYDSLLDTEPAEDDA
jgi:hypothetical protein